MKINRIKKSEFKAWLKSKKSHQTVGFKEEANDCPIARVYKSFYKLKNSQVSVDSFGSVGLHSGTEYYKYFSYRKWTKDFIEKIDGSSKNRITAKKALKILKSI